MEVIYTGLHQTPEQIVETVIQEDADAVGLSILSGAHMTLVPRIVELLSEQGIDDVLLTVGGTIPSDDIPELKRLGVGRGVHARRADAGHHRLHPGRRRRPPARLSDRSTRRSAAPD
jgi:methylmalonyl-CoA mutase cobalamin-binding domain/chain